MSPTVRRVAAIIIGLVLAMLIVAGFDMVIGKTWPLPAGTNLKDPVAMRAAMAAMPLAALCTMVVGWAIAAGVGAAVAVKRSPEHEVRSGYIVTAIFFAGTMANLVSLPHPTWMYAAAFICVLLAGLAGSRAAAATFMHAHPVAPGT